METILDVLTTVGLPSFRGRNQVTVGTKGSLLNFATHSDVAVSFSLNSIDSSIQHHNDSFPMYLRSHHEWIFDALSDGEV